MSASQFGCYAVYGFDFLTDFCLLTLSNIEDVYFPHGSLCFCFMCYKALVSVARTFNIDIFT